MIQKELFMTRKDGIKLYKTYSDKDFYIIQNETGYKYIAAIDVENAEYTYSESDEKIELPEEEKEENE